MTRPPRSLHPPRPRLSEVPVPPQAHGARCGTFLAEHFPAISPAALGRLFRERKVRVNGIPCGPELQLNPGGTVMWILAGMRSLMS